MALQNAPAPQKCTPVAKMKCLGALTIILTLATIFLAAGAPVLLDAEEQFYQGHIDTFDEMVESGIGPIKEQMLDVQIVDLSNGSFDLLEEPDFFGDSTGAFDDLLDSAIDYIMQDGVDEEHFLKTYDDGFLHYDNGIRINEDWLNTNTYKVYTSGGQELDLDATEKDGTWYKSMAQSIKEEFNVVDNYIKADQNLEEVAFKRTGYTIGAAAAGTGAGGALIGLGLTLNKHRKSKINKKQEAEIFVRKTLAEYKVPVEKIDHKKLRDPTYCHVNCDPEQGTGPEAWEEGYLEDVSHWDPKRETVSIKFPQENGTFDCREGPRESILIRRPLEDFQELHRIKAKYPEAYKRAEKAIKSGYPTLEMARLDSRSVPSDQSESATQIPEIN